jgi:hypothetical protein
MGIHGIAKYLCTYDKVGIVKSGHMFCFKKIDGKNVMYLIKDNEVLSEEIGADEMAKIYWIDKNKIIFLSESKYFSLKLAHSIIGKILKTRKGLIDVNRVKMFKDKETNSWMLLGIRGDAVSILSIGSNETAIELEFSDENMGRIVLGDEYKRMEVKGMGIKGEDTVYLRLETDEGRQYIATYNKIGNGRIQWRTKRLEEVKEVRWFDEEEIEMEKIEYIGKGCEQD